VSVYFFDKPLSRHDLEFVMAELELGRIPDQIQIPHVLPVLAAGPIDGVTRDRHASLLRSLIRRAGIGAGGAQPIIVAPSEMYWCAALALAVYEVAGYLPYIVQTEEQRAAIDSPGPTRILDAHGLTGLKP
jgi:hypothetical protein